MLYTNFEVSPARDLVPTILFTNSCFELSGGIAELAERNHTGSTHVTFSGTSS